MDGHFVPNLTVGPAVVAAVRARVKIPLDVHLMLSDPDRFIEPFADAGASILTVHARRCRTCTGRSRSSGGGGCARGCRSTRPPR